MPSDSGNCLPCNMFTDVGVSPPQPKIPIPPCVEPVSEDANELSPVGLLSNAEVSPPSPEAGLLSPIVGALSGILTAVTTPYEGEGNDNGMKPRTDAVSPINARSGSEDTVVVIPRTEPQTHNGPQSDDPLQANGGSQVDDGPQTDDDRISPIRLSETPPSCYAKANVEDWLERTANAETPTGRPARFEQYSDLDAKLFPVINRVSMSVRSDVQAEASAKEDAPAKRNLAKVLRWGKGQGNGTGSKEQAQKPKSELVSQDQPANQSVAQSESQSVAQLENQHLIQSRNEPTAQTENQPLTHSESQPLSERRPNTHRPRKRVPRRLLRRRRGIDPNGSQGETNQYRRKGCLKLLVKIVKDMKCCCCLCFTFFLRGHSSKPTSNAPNSILANNPTDDPHNGPNGSQSNKHVEYHTTTGSVGHSELNTSHQAEVPGNQESDHVSTSRTEVQAFTTQESYRVSTGQTQNRERISQETLRASQGHTPPTRESVPEPGDPNYRPEHFSEFPTSSVREEVCEQDSSNHKTRPGRNLAREYGDPNHNPEHPSNTSISPEREAEYKKKWSEYQAELTKKIKEYSTKDDLLGDSLTSWAPESAPSLPSISSIESARELAERSEPGRPNPSTPNLERVETAVRPPELLFPLGLPVPAAGFEHELRQETDESVSTQLEMRVRSLEERTETLAFRTSMILQGGEDMLALDREREELAQDIESEIASLEAQSTSSLQQEAEGPTHAQTEQEEPSVQESEKPAPRTSENTAPQTEQEEPSVQVPEAEDISGTEPTAEALEDELGEPVVRLPQIQRSSPPTIPYLPDHLQPEMREPAPQQREDLDISAILRPRTQGSTAPETEVRDFANRPQPNPNRYTVNLVVGGPENFPRTYSFLRSQIQPSSEWFNNKIHELDGVNSPIIYLPQVDKSSFDLFAHWVQKSEVELARRTSKKTDFLGGKMDWKCLTRAIKCREELESYLFQNALIRKTHDAAMSYDFMPSVKELNYIYQKTLSGHPLRQLVVDIFLSDLGLVADDLMTNEFLVDVVTRIMEHNAAYNSRYGPYIIIREAFLRNVWEYLLGFSDDEFSEFNCDW